MYVRIGIKEWILHKGMDFEIIIKYRKTMACLCSFSCERKWKDSGSQTVTSAGH